MGMSRWRTTTPDGEVIEVQQCRAARLDHVPFTWSFPRRAISSTVLRIARRIDEPAVAERLRAGGHPAVEHDWEPDPLHELGGVDRQVLDFVDDLPHAKLLAICRRDARELVESDTRALAVLGDAIPGLEDDLRRSSLGLAALDINQHRVRAAAIDLLRGGWHLGSDELPLAARDTLSEPVGAPPVRPLVDARDDARGRR